MNGGERRPPRRRLTARDVALEVLVRVEKEGSYSNLELNRALKEAQLERADAALATELVYGTIQRLNTIDGVLAHKVQRGLSKLKPWVRNLLRMTAYQLRYLDRVPPHAAVNEAVAIAKRRGQQAMGGFVNGVLRAIMREPELWTAPPADSAVSRIAWEHSHPEWLVARWIAAYGEAETAAMCAANNRPPHSSVRVNRLRGTRRRCWPRCARTATGPKRPRSRRTASQPPAPATWRTAPGIATAAYRYRTRARCSSSRRCGRNRACASSTAALPQAANRPISPSGWAIWAKSRRTTFTPTRWRLSRNKPPGLLTWLRVMNVDAAELGQALPPASFDAVLLDAPCTGFGVIRRKPDIKWAKREEDVAAIAALQERLLTEAARMVRPGGRLVYSTCTVEPEENGDAVRRFLERTPGWALDASWTGALPQEALDAALRRSPAGMLQVLPQDAGSDGFFIACLQRTDGPGEPGAGRN